MFAITERLLLRPGWAEDAPALSRAIADEAVARNTARVPWPYALGDAQRFLASEAVALRPSFLICLRDSGRLIGGIGIHGERPELGYWLARDQWGRGYATEAGCAVLGCARSLGLERLWAGHMLDNPASGRVLRKLGFRESGREERHSLARGGPVACATYEREEAEQGQLTPLAA